MGQQFSLKRRSEAEKGPPPVPEKKAKAPADDEDGDEVGMVVPPFVQDDQPSALMNDVILSILFGYLRGNDLKSCRLVCKKWTIQTLPFARSRFTVTIRGIDAYTFVKLIQANELGIPFGKFFLDSSFDTSRVVGKEFLQLCGETTKEIILGGEDPYTIERISMLLRSVPNLQSLTLESSLSFKDSENVKLFPGNTRLKMTFLKTINFTNTYLEGVAKKYPTFCEELFEAAENISTLDLTPFSSELGLKILEIIENPGRGSEIQKLIIKNMTEKHLEILLGMARRGMELKQFDCEFHKSDANSVDWCPLIKCFKNSLTCVKLNKCFPNPKTLVNFERMPKLRELQFSGHIPTNLNPAGSQNFNNMFPILEKLDLSLFLREKIEFYNFFSGDEDYPCPTMRSLQIPTIPMKMENLNRIFIIFPNLKALKCQITEGEVMRKIWTHMPQLEELEISERLKSSENVDSFITGIPVEEIKKLDKKIFFDSIQQQTVENRRVRILMETNKYSTLPSIRNLTNLKSLKLNFDTEHCEIQTRRFLTDLTGYLALYSLKSLGQLWISFSDISRTCADILAKDMGLHTWKFWLKCPERSSSTFRGMRPSAYVYESE